MTKKLKMQLMVNDDNPIRKKVFNDKVSTAFAPYRVRPFEFAPTLYRVRSRTFRVRPHQVQFAPRLSHV